LKLVDRCLVAGCLCVFRACELLIHCPDTFLLPRVLIFLLVFFLLEACDVLAVTLIAGFENCLDASHAVGILLLSYFTDFVDSCAELRIPCPLDHTRCFHQKSYIANIDLEVASLRHWSRTIVLYLPLFAHFILPEHVVAVKIAYLA